jgi:cell division protein FtsI/penicillin-binding protein 2
MTQETPSPTKSSKPVHARLAFLLLGVLIGAVFVLAIRFINYQPEHTHYHANFAVYANGQREQFKSPQYYEEVKICDLNGTSPQARVHMHNEENGVIHVHDKAVTWGDFFENLGWTIGPNFIRTSNKLYAVEYYPER